MPVLDPFTSENPVWGSTMLNIGSGIGSLPSSLTYANYIASLGAFALWPLSETTGTNADDPIGGFDGTYAAGITLHAATFPDSSPAPLFDATDDVIAIPSVSLDTPFDGAIGTMAGWVKVRTSSVWTDATSRIVLSMGVDANNRIYFNKTAANNRFDMFYAAGGTSKQIANTSYSPSRWFHAAITWSKSADQVKFYLDGVQVGSTLTGLGVWAGTLANGFTAVGNFTQSGGAFFWDGYIKYPFVANRVFSAAEIASLVPASYLV